MALSRDVKWRARTVAASRVGRGSTTRSLPAFREASWEEALDARGRRLGESEIEHGGHASRDSAPRSARMKRPISSRSSFARASGPTMSITARASVTPRQSAALDRIDRIGRSHDDLRRCRNADVAIIIAGPTPPPTIRSPRPSSSRREARAKLIVVDPRRESDAPTTPTIIAESSLGATSPSTTR